VRVDKSRGTCKKQIFPAWIDGQHHQHKRSGAVACRDMAASAQGSTRDHDSKVRRHKRWEGRGAHLRPKGPGGEGVGEEGLDAVATRCSEAEEGGGVRGDPVWLLPRERLRLGEGRRWHASTDNQPRVLLLLLRQRRRIGEGKPQSARV
jgi:hypothetical protein